MTRNFNREDKISIFLRSQNANLLSKTYCKTRMTLLDKVEK